MIFRVAGIGGINNMDDARKSMGVKYGDTQIVLTGDAVECRNFSLKKDGRAEVRNGRTKIYSGSGLKDFYVTDDGTLAFFMEGQSLKRLKSDYTAETLETGLNPNFRMSYEEHRSKENYVFMTNGVDRLKYSRERETVEAWGVDAPNDAPVVAATGGELHGGEYLVCYTGVTAGDHETAPSPFARIAIGGGGISIIIPAFADSQVLTKRIYLSYANVGHEETPVWLSGEINNNTTTYTHRGSERGLASECSTWNYKRPPGGSIVLSYRQRIYVAVNDMVFFSEPMLPEAFREHNYLQVYGDVTGLTRTGEGIYVHTFEQTFPFFGLDPEDMTMRSPIGVGCIKGSPVKDRYGNYWWRTDRNWARHGSSGPELVDKLKHEYEIGRTGDVYSGYDPLTEEVLMSIRE